VGLAVSVCRAAGELGHSLAIIGSVASSVYGEPRATNDVDRLIQLSRNDAAKLVHDFPSE
jgi:hypothetical protein